MAFFDGYLSKIGDTLHGVLAGITTVLVRKADNTAVMLAGNDRGAALVEIDPLTAAGMVPVAEDNTNGVYATRSKPLATSTYSWPVVQSAALEASTVVSANPGVVRSVFARLDSTAPTGTYYLQLLNYAALPANGAVNHLAAPIKWQHVSGIDDFPLGWDFGEGGLFASVGAVLVLSSTEFTKTISGAYLSTTAQRMVS